MASAGVTQSLAAGRWDDLGESEASLACGLTALQPGRHRGGPDLSLVSLLREFQVCPGSSL